MIEKKHIGNFLRKGYPTKKYLQMIKDYDGNQMPIMDFVDIVCKNWNHGDIGYKLHKKHKGKRKFELHTLGWSGNEEIIQKIIKNIYLTHFLMKYYKWETGGHYYFEIRYIKLMQNCLFGQFRC
ncbi:MAG: hypothetical protein WC466_08180 [Candidatus Izemoplasmatales bacterium]